MAFLHNCCPRANTPQSSNSLMARIDAHAISGMRSEHHNTLIVFTVVLRGILSIKRWLTRFQGAEGFAAGNFTVDQVSGPIASSDDATDGWLRYGIQLIFL